jgi:hypothetical protein
LYRMQRISSCLAFLKKLLRKHCGIHFFGLIAKARWYFLLLLICCCNQAVLIDHPVKGIQLLFHHGMPF